MRKRWITYYFLSFIIGSATITSCGSDGDKLSRDKMVKVLHDIQLAEAVYQTKYDEFRDKKEKDALVQGVLEKHGITQAELDSSLVWYADNAEIYMRVNDSVISSLKKAVSVIDKSYARGLGVSKANNSILPSYSYLSEDVPTLTFNIDSTLVSSYPRFSLEFNSLGIQDIMKAELEVVFEYADTTIIRNKSLNKDDHFEIKIGEDTLALKNISGYFHIDSHRILNNKVLLYNILLKNIVTQNDSTTLKTDTLSVVK